MIRPAMFLFVEMLGQPNHFGETLLHFGGIRTEFGHNLSEFLWAVKGKDISGC